jgi:CheY-like chemotaxis protein
MMATGKRALLIDDDAAVRTALCDIVTELGYVADVAPSGAAGLELFEKNHYDVVLTDLLMPGITGWEVLEAVRRLDPKIPVVIVTGAAVWTDDRRVAQPGVALVCKPVDVDFLETAIARVLRELG